MDKQKAILETSDLKAVGPYSLARFSGNLVFLSGQIGTGPDKALVPGGITAEFSRIVHNLEGVLTAAGSDMKNILRVVVYLDDMNEYGVLNEVYAREFSKFMDVFPVRSTIQVAKLPLGAKVELEVTAFIN